MVLFLEMKKSKGRINWQRVSSRVLFERVKLELRHSSEFVKYATGHINLAVKAKDVSWARFRI